MFTKYKTEREVNKLAIDPNSIENKDLNNAETVGSDHFSDAVIPTNSYEIDSQQFDFNNESESLW